eukprot:7121087-Prymnesium_polylepis.2
MEAAAASGWLQPPGLTFDTGTTDGVGAPMASACDECVLHSRGESDVGGCGGRGGQQGEAARLPDG